jgi:charged multivesicular body protein 7
MLPVLVSDTGLVKAELRDAKTYIPLHQFLSSVQSVYDPGWLPLRIATYIVGKPLLWALKQLNVVESDEGGHQSDADKWKKIKGDYILLDLVEFAAKAVISHQRAKGSVTLTDRLYTMDTFRIEFASVAFSHKVLSDLDIKALVKYLERDSKMVCVDREVPFLLLCFQFSSDVIPIQVIKFIDEGVMEPQTITAVDHGLVELNVAIHGLQSQIDNIQQKISGCVFVVLPTSQITPDDHCLDGPIKLPRHFSKNRRNWLSVTCDRESSLMIS